MKKIAENIKTLRKERQLTQEQLAEALEVTVGAVYKWENGRSVPEIGMLMQLADLFEVSLDALVGFEVQNSGAGILVERICDLQTQKKYKEAISEAEKALLRYPNHFQIVLRAGSLYGHAGAELKNNRYLYRSIELLEYAIRLLSQNTDPEISEISIQGNIAQHYILLGQGEKGIEILKKYNVNGVHDALIAISYTGSNIMNVKTSGLDIRDAEPYMVRAYFNNLTSSILTMMAYANYYFETRDYRSGREAHLYLAEMLQNMKIKKDAVAYVDKIIALSYYGCASFSQYLQENDAVISYLRLAYEIAKRFDSAPTSGVENMRFCIGDAKTATAYDDLGESAIGAINMYVAEEKQDSLLYQTWKQICGGIQ